MTSDEIQCLLKICGSLYSRYRQNLENIYSQNWNTLKETEQQCLAILSVGLPNDAKQLTIKTLGQYIKYIHMFWAHVEEEILPISFTYIYWELEQPERVPCLLIQTDNSMINGDRSVSLVYIRQIKTNKYQEQARIKEQIISANQENERVLINWCESLFQAMRQHFEEYKNDTF